MFSDFTVQKLCACLTSAVVLPPGEFVSFPGGNVDFTCLTSPASGDMIVSVQWIVNGSLLDTLVLRGVSTEFSPISNGIGLLEFTNLPLEYNTTSIRCIVSFETGLTISSNEATLLLLQGKDDHYSKTLLVHVIDNL